MKLRINFAVGCISGYLVTLVAVTAEDLLQGLTISQSVSPFYHHLLPIFAGVITGLYAGYEARRASEAKNLAEQEQAQLRNLIFQSSIGFFVATPSGRVKFVNDILLQMLGSEGPEEFEHRHMPQICSLMKITDKQVVRIVSLKNKEGQAISCTATLQGYYKDDALVSIVGSLSIDEIPSESLIITVCAYCKKMAKQGEGWRPAVEAYQHFETEIESHSGKIGQSHGICPKCYEGIIKEIPK